MIFGGVNQHHQVNALKAGVDILIATPGRLLDLFNQRHVKLDRVSILVLDEADRMLDMGFIHDVRKVVAACRKQRQTLLFSATMPPAIAKLANDILDNPARIDVSPKTVAVDRIEQRVYFVGAKDKRQMLNELLADPAFDRVLVFTRTKRGADRVCKQLKQAGVAADALHGNKAQNARVRALEDFRKGKVRVLVATDIAARGIDVPNISHVINYELPNEPESYVHRIGRTARAGAGGAALSFCDQSERPYLRDIESPDEAQRGCGGASSRRDAVRSCGRSAAARMGSANHQGSAAAALAKPAHFRNPHAGGADQQARSGLSPFRRRT